MAGLLKREVVERRWRTGERGEMANGRVGLGEEGEILGGARLTNRAKMLTKPLARLVRTFRLNLNVRRAARCRVANEYPLFGGRAPHRNQGSHDA